MTATAATSQRQKTSKQTRWLPGVNNAILKKAKTACEVSGHDIDNHFPGVRKMVELGAGSERNDDILLTDLLTDLLTHAIAKMLSTGFTTPQSIRCTAKQKDSQKFNSSTHQHTHNHGAVHD
jgi:hypothetical protein